MVSQHLETPPFIHEGSSDASFFGKRLNFMVVVSALCAEVEPQARHYTGQFVRAPNKKYYVDNQGVISILMRPMHFLLDIFTEMYSFVSELIH
jgi:hypothetical protein